MRTYRIEHPAAAIHVPLLGRKLADSFGFPEADAEEWFQYAGQANLTTLWEGEALIGGLICIPQAQFFGGRSVPAVGIAGVGVLAEYRRGGAARTLMTETLRRLRAQGVALSTLFASTHGLYAHVGYGVAGTRHQGRTPTTAIQVALEPTLEVRRLGDSDRPAQHALYTQQATHRPGHLDRGPYVWYRTQRTWRGRPAISTGVFAGEQLVGYVTWRRASSEPPSELLLTDVVAPTAAIARRIWGFLKDHGTMAPAVTGFTSPDDPFWLTLPQPGPEVVLSQTWMLRLVDLPAAIAARGFAAALSLEVCFQVEDEIIKENNGIWTLSVADGVGRLRPGGTPEAQVRIQGLAGLYSGFHTTRALAARGLLEASPGAADRLDTLFAGAAPWLPDMF